MDGKPVGSITLLTLLNRIKPWQRPHIKKQVCWIGTVLSEKSVMKKYGYSDKEMLQGMAGSLISTLNKYIYLHSIC